MLFINVSHFICCFICSSFQNMDYKIHVVIPFSLAINRNIKLDIHVLKIFLKFFCIYLSLKEKCHFYIPIILLLRLLLGFINILHYSKEQFSLSSISTFTCSICLMKNLYSFPQRYFCLLSCVCS